MKKTRKNLTYKAAQFAKQKHAGQIRRGSGAAYFSHVEEVAIMVAAILDDAEAVAAAYLHDTVEDCGVTLDEIAEKFGYRVAQIVEGLTDVYTKEAYPAMSRAERKQKERERLGMTDPVTQTIKLCDLISNTRSIVRDDKKFAPTYLDEKEALLEHLTKGVEHYRKLAKLTLAAGRRALR